MVDPYIISWTCKVTPYLVENPTFPGQIAGWYVLVETAALLPSGPETPGQRMLYGPMPADQVEPFCAEVIKSEGESRKRFIEQWMGK